MTIVSLDLGCRGNGQQAADAGSRLNGDLMGLQIDRCYGPFNFVSTRRIFGASAAGTVFLGVVLRVVVGFGAGGVASSGRGTFQFGGRLGHCHKWPRRDRQPPRM